MNFNLEGFKLIKPLRTRSGQPSTTKIEYGSFKGQEVVLKWYKRGERSENDLRQEVFALNSLKDNLNTPNLILYDKEKLLVVMSYCGVNPFECLSPSGVKLPCDFLKKVINLYKQIGEDFGIWHDDLHVGNITAIDDKVYLIDWCGFGTKPSPDVEREVKRLWNINGCANE